VGETRHRPPIRRTERGRRLLPCFEMGTLNVGTAQNGNTRALLAMHAVGPPSACFQAG
jgi:hypothetical protein